MTNSLELKVSYLALDVMVNMVNVTKNEFILKLAICHENKAITFLYIKICLKIFKGSQNNTADFIFTDVLY